MITVGSLFAGVGGFDLGFGAAGCRTMWQVEINPWCQKVLRRHWPAALLKGDVQEVHGAHLSPVDVITFGSPCQDMSVAGARAGLDGSRSTLFYEATRIIGEMREATNGRCPAWAVWENVPGALSSDSGNDFASVLNALAAVGAVDLEWRVLDARFFGVPQRRRRVFVLAGFDPRAGGARPVLLEPEGRGWRPTAGRAAGESVAALTANGAGTCGADDNQAQAGHLIPALAATIRTGRATAASGATARTTWSIGFAWQAGGRKDACGAFCDDDTSPTLPANQTMAVAYQCGGGDVGPMGALRAEPHSAGGGVPFVPAYPLAMRGRDDGAQLEMGEPDTYNALRAGDGGSSRANALLTPDLAVRRLTPRECERLMGWPDDHTRWTADGKQIPDSQRYRMCGNGVVAPVAEWIAHRILEVA